MAKKILAVIRASTEQQETVSQKRELVDYILRLRERFTEEEIDFIEVAGASARKKNEKYLQMLEDIKSRITNSQTIKAVALWSLDRLGRNEDSLIDMKTWFLNNHVQVYCKDPQFQLLDEDGKESDGASIAFSVYASLIKIHTRDLFEKFHRGKAENARRQKYNGGTIPYGYTLDESKHFVVNETEAEIIRDVFERYSNQQSIRDISKHYHEIGDDRMTISFIQTILTNEFLTGRPTHEGNKKVVETLHGKTREWISFSRTYPPIISEELFDKCRDIAKTNNKNISKARNIYFAKGIFRCPHCGGKFSPSGSKVAYHCYDAFNANKIYNHNRKEDGTIRCTNRASISINIADSLLWHTAQQIEAEKWLYQRETEQAEYNRKIKEIDDKLNGIEKRRDTLLQKKERLGLSFSDRMVTRETYDKKKEQLFKEERAINQDEIRLHEERQRLSTMLSKSTGRKDALNIKETINDIEDIFNTLNNIKDDGTRNDIIHDCIKEITLQTDCTRGIYYQRLGQKKRSTLRVIDITPFIGDTVRYYYLSTNDKVFIEDDNGEFEEIEYDYLRRYFDTGKIERRQRERDKRQREHAAQKEGFLTIIECMQISGMTYGQVYSLIKSNKVAAKKILKAWLISKEDFLRYIS